MGDLCDGGLESGLRPHDHISQALRQLHWLLVEFHMEFKLYLITHYRIPRNENAIIPGEKREQVRDNH